MRSNNFKNAIVSPFCSHSKEYTSSQSGVSPRILSSEIHPILQSSGLQHWFKNWQQLRKHKLTASTFAMAVGFWPRRRIQLWLEKLGAIEPFAGNLATCWSNIKEEEALERYKLITGNTVSFPEFQVYGKQNPDDNWLAASPDGSVDKLVYGLVLSRGS
ncbi:Restriction endonuclease [Abeliophyllum distichum]|uniref:Restriction endonuclease n=1 Tax=Abeliophyllum distichum TaxID=126358 RepID=A0ABD1RT27_9LAMI